MRLRRTRTFPAPTRASERMTEQLRALADGFDAGVRVGGIEVSHSDFDDGMTGEVTVDGTATSLLARYVAPVTEAHVRARQVEDRRRTYLAAHGLEPAAHGQAGPRTAADTVALLEELGFAPEAGLPQDQLQYRVETEGVRAAGVGRRHLFSQVHDLGEHPSEAFEDWAAEIEEIARGRPGRGLCPLAARGSVGGRTDGPAPVRGPGRRAGG